MRKWWLACILAVMGQGAFASQEEIPSVEKLLRAMDDAERSYYFQSFDYSMHTLPQGQKYPWKSYASEGWFEAGPVYKGKGTVCRDFKEYVSHRGMYALESEGIGCRRVGKSGWCRLHKGALTSCALEPPDNILDEAIETMDDAERRYGRADTSVRSFWYRWWPF